MAALSGPAGDSIASALLANGRFLLSRSFKYHRPRGPLTMAGQDANSLVQLPRSPTCWPMHTADVGLQVTGRTSTARWTTTATPTWASFPNSCRWAFYYRSFYKPKGMWKLWEPIIRKKAGLACST
jgi:sarcosine oxidase subunit alpha